LSVTSFGVIVTPGSLQLTPRHASRAASVFETCPGAPVFLKEINRHGPRSS